MTIGFFSHFIHFCYSFNNSFNRTAKIFIQQIYSLKKTLKLFILRIYLFKKIENYSFKNLFIQKNPKLFINKFIYSKKSEIIHSKKIFIQMKNGLSPRAMREAQRTQKMTP